MMNIGIAYDIKEDYQFNDQNWSHFDFTTLSEVSHVKEALEKSGNHVHLLGNFEKLLSALQCNQLNGIDLVFNMSEGIQSRNREGWVPSLLEMYHKPYTGTDTYGLNLALNKLHTKVIASFLNISTPDFCFIESEIEQEIPINFPCVLKPNYEGSSSGIVLVKNNAELNYYAKQLLHTYHQPVLCEHYIDGREFTVSLIGNGIQTHAIGIIETIRKDGTPIGIFTDQDKLHGCCARQIPTDLSEIIKQKAISQAIQIHRFIGCRDFNRIDYRMDKQGNLFFLEMNPLPGMGETSAFPICCELNGLEFHDVINEIVWQACSRYSSKDGRYS